MAFGAEVADGWVVRGWLTGEGTACEGGFDVPRALDVDLHGEVAAWEHGGGVGAEEDLGAAGDVKDATCGEVGDCEAGLWGQVEVSERLVESVAAVFRVGEDCFGGGVLLDADEAWRTAAVVGGHVGGVVGGYEEEVRSGEEIQGGGAEGEGV